MAPLGLVGHGGGDFVATAGVEGGGGEVGVWALAEGKSCSCGGNGEEGYQESIGKLHDIGV